METTSFKIQNNINRVTNHESPAGEWLEGAVVTKFGIVIAFSDGAASPYTRLDFVHDGRLYIRTYEEWVSTKTLSRRANSFAKEITRQKD